MNNTNTGLNLNSLPTDVREALSQTFGEEFASASTLNELFNVSEESPALPTAPTAEVSLQSEGELSINLEEMISVPIVESAAEPTQLRAETEVPIDIKTLYTEPTPKKTKKASLEDIVKTSIIASEQSLTTEMSANLVEESELRYSDAAWYDSLSSSSVTIIGAGGIGSWLTLILSKLNVDITLFDHDVFEPVNRAGQIFLLQNIGSSKTSAVKNLCSAINGIGKINCIQLQWTPVRFGLCPITIVAVDNMSVRKDAFMKWRQIWGNNPKALFIDPRLAAELYQIYSIKGGDKLAQNRYLEEWFSDYDADETPCSYKQTAYMAAMLGGRIVNNIVNFLALDSKKEIIPRVVPFYIEYEAYGYEKIINYA